MENRHEIEQLSRTSCFTTRAKLLNAELIGVIAVWQYLRWLSASTQKEMLPFSTLKCSQLKFQASCTLETTIKIQSLAQQPVCNLALGDDSSSAPHGQWCPRATASACRRGYPPVNGGSRPPNCPADADGKTPFMMLGAPCSQCHKPPTWMVAIQKFLESHWGWWILLLYKPWLKFMEIYGKWVINQGMESHMFKHIPVPSCCESLYQEKSGQTAQSHWWRLASQIAVAICTVWAAWPSGNQTWQWQILRFSRYLKEIIS